MKKGIHPENYRLVAFKDMSNDHVFLCRSAVSTKETIEVNGETYPVYKMEISNTSHPFYTGKMKLVDTAGRVDKFMSRYAKRYDTSPAYPHPGRRNVPTTAKHALDRRTVPPRRHSLDRKIALSATKRTKNKRAAHKCSPLSLNAESAYFAPFLS